MGLCRQIQLAGLKAIYASDLGRIAPRSIAGVGAILTFHHVRPARPQGFQPNRHLEIAPEFLDQVVTRIAASDSEIVSLDEARRRLVEGDFRRRFFVLTFDDGYRDIHDFAYPVLKRHALPFAIFIASRFADGTGDLWWVTLERIVAAGERLETRVGTENFTFTLTDDACRDKAFATLYAALRALPDDEEIHATIGEMAESVGISTEDTCRDLCMDWQQLAELAADPLVTVGAHSDTHLILRKASADEARADIARNLTRMEAELGVRPEHFCYPVGDVTSAGPRDFRLIEEFGFKTALTTRRGMLFPEHRDHLTALPRISVNGNYQQFAYTGALLSGIPTALVNRFSRLDVE